MMINHNSPVIVIADSGLLSAAGRADKKQKNLERLKHLEKREQKR
jgi:hypothetical protein